MIGKLTIYYSIDNCGDGPAYPRLYDTKELAEWHQEHLDEGWGEPCTGEIVVEGDNLSCPELQSKEIVDPHYYGVFVEGRLAHKQYAYPENHANDEGVQKLTETLNH